MRNDVSVDYLTSSGVSGITLGDVTGNFLTRKSRAKKEIKPSAKAWSCRIVPSKRVISSPVPNNSIIQFLFHYFIKCT